LLTTSDPVVSFQSVSKTYRYRDVQTLKEFLPKFLRREDKPSTFNALDNVSFSIGQGETVALVGTNGSGKSTALKIVAGVTRPSSGTATVIGRVAPLLQLGAGFHPDLTGRENVFLNGCILGLTDEEIAAAIPDIISFAEIEQFIDSPVKHYSSGMYLRLAFSVAVHAQPDILIIDEALSVGDLAFQAKCIDHIRKMQKAGVTLLFVSHSTSMVEEFCDRAIWLNKGVLRMQGKPSDVIKAYKDSLDLNQALMADAVANF
jgi:ABC-type polysaccharide/polyol phosphate transport system ATPase subunit